jgi:hypothetical protein
VQRFCSPDCVPEDKVDEEAVVEVEASDAAGAVDDAPALRLRFLLFC